MQLTRDEKEQKRALEKWTKQIHKDVRRAQQMQNSSLTRGDDTTFSAYEQVESILLRAMDKVKDQ